jgi:protocatechuate 3,4-dioxygenase beta subunit
MKKILIGIFALLLVVAVSANDKGEKTNNDTQNTATVVLSGTILDSNSGELLVGVDVQIEGANAKTYTDLDGSFLFENIKPDEYKLVANYISYKNVPKHKKKEPLF